MLRRFFSSGRQKFDLIGPPCPRSLLRPVRLAVPDGETRAHFDYRTERLRVHRWNESFWTEHNDNFHRERKEFVAAKLKKHPEKKSLSADEMSVFYKAFLDKNKKMHINYNFEWYGKNIKLLVLAFDVVVERALKKLKLV